MKCIESPANWLTTLVPSRVSWREALRACMAEALSPYRENRLRQTIERLRREPVPRNWRQLGSLMVLDAVLDSTLRSGVSVVVSGGTLLGAVRDHRFAGRPSDVDFRVLGGELEARLIVQHIPRHELRVGRVRKKPDRLHVPIRFGSAGLGATFVSAALLLDLEFFSANSQKYPWADGQRGLPIDTRHWTVSQNQVGNIYGRQVRIPDQWEQYLCAVYGPDWRVPA